MTTMMMMPLRDNPMSDHNYIAALNSGSDDDMRHGRIQQSPPARVSVGESVSTSLTCIPSGRKTKTTLPAGFTPGPYSVVLGRGKVNDYTGNRRLKIFASLHLPDYVAAKSRREKSYVVARVMETVQQCNGGVGAFIRKENNGIWYEVEDSMAREKIGVVFRDLSPAGQYRSSTKNKVARRRQRKASSSPLSHAAQQQQQAAVSRSLSIVDFDFSSVQQDQENDFMSLSDDDFAAAFTVR